MKYVAVIDTDEKPVCCEFIGCNGNVAPYLIGATTDIKSLDQGSVIDKIRAEIEQSRQCYEVSMDYGDAYREQELSWVLELIDKYTGKDYNK
jgi:hypothetical protein